MSVLVFDFGTRHIGVAAVVAESRIALPIATLAAKRGRPSLQSLTQLVKEWSPSEFVLGLPLNIDQTDSPMCEAVRDFGSYLTHHFNLPVAFVDERLSTLEATQRSSIDAISSRRKSGKRKGKSKRHSSGNHALAAQVIGETWLAERTESNSVASSQE